MAMPEQLMAQQAVIFLHRIILKKTPAQIYELLEFQARSYLSAAPGLIYKTNTMRRDRSMINKTVRIYAKFPKHVMFFPEFHFVKYAKHWNIDTSKNYT